MRMIKTKKHFAISFCLFAFLAAPFFCSASSPEKIFYMSKLKEEEGIASLEKNSNKIDILAPQFYIINEKLLINGGLDSRLKQTINRLPAQAAKKLKVMPLVTNADFNQNIIHALLTSPSAQDAVIKGLVYLAKKNDYIGWQFDFENINYLDKDLYSAFVEKAAKSLHKSGLILSVAAVSRSTDYENTDAFKNWGGAFDYARLSKAVDFISLMTYDDPNSAGPVASLPFINEVLNYVKDKIPPEKLSLGIPLYYWGWQAEPFKKITFSGTYKRLLGIMSNFSHALGFNANLGASWLSYFWEGNQYMLWFQNSQSLESKLDIIKQNNFRGFSAWVLGVEVPGIWDVLR